MTNHSTSIETLRERIGDAVSISRRGKRGIYSADFWHIGRHTRRSLQTRNLKIARQRAIRLEAELAAGAYALPAKPTSVAKAREQYMSAIKGAGRATKTITAYDAETKTFLEFLTQTGVHALSQIQPQHFLNYRIERAKKLADKTLFTRLMIVKSFLNWCAGDGGLLSYNPLRRCKIDRPYESPKFTPTAEQVNAVLSKAVGGRLAQYAALAFAGLRVTEMAMLRPQDVDLKADWLRIVGRDGWVPKTRQARRVPVHPRLLDTLKAYIATLTTASERLYFFSDMADGSRPINVRTINVELQTLANSLEIPIGRKKNGLVVHSLRHYFETQAVDSGVPQFVVDAWMGHAGQALMGRAYYGLTDAKHVGFMKLIKF
jgi:integrase